MCHAQAAAVTPRQLLLTKEEQHNASCMFTMPESPMQTAVLKDHATKADQLLVCKLLANISAAEHSQKAGSVHPHACCQCTTNRSSSSTINAQRWSQLQSHMRLSEENLPSWHEKSRAPTWTQSSES